MPRSIELIAMLKTAGGQGVAFALAAALTLGGLPHTGNAQVSKNAQTSKKLQVASLEGSWSGGGTVTFASGATEQARCRAHYSRAGKDSYTVNATCATVSGRAAQEARPSIASERRPL